MTIRRIALVSEHASPLATIGGVDAGGQTVHVAALAGALAAQGANVIIYTRRDNVALPREVTIRPGVIVHHVPAGPPAPLLKDEIWPFMDDFAEYLESEWRWQRPDIVHSHFWMSGYAALRTCRRIDLPVVHTYHALGTVKHRNNPLHDTSPTGRIDVEWNTGMQMDRIIATCHDEVDELRAMGIDHNRIEIVPCGVDTHAFAPSGPQLLEPSPSKRILVIGRLVERKGMGNAIEALAEVPDAELVLAGGPPLELLDEDVEVSRLRAIAESHGLTARVRIIGCVRHQDMPALIRSSDIVACIPWYEPFGIVPIEAMACGVPVVGSATGGLLDTVIDGTTGILVPPRSPHRAAEAFNTLLQNDELRRRMGRAGTRRARRNYDWTRIAQATRRIYERVITSQVSTSDLEAV